MRSLFVLLSLVACSAPGDMMVAPDASPSDGTDTDASPATGVASVVVTSYLNQYVPNLSVVFFRPDGSINAVVKTDAMGNASAMIERSSFVAVVDAQVNAAIINPGDTLRFGPDLTAEEPNGSVRVTWPARANVGPTRYYRAYTPCGFSAETTFTAATIPLARGCSTDPFDVVVTSRYSSHGVDAVMIRHDVQATGELVTVNLADNNGAWQIGASTTVELTNLPNASATSRLTTCTARQYLGSLYFFGEGTYTYGTSCNMLRMPEPESTYVVEASYERNDERRFAVQTSNPFPQPMIGALDGANSLPWITTFAFDPASRRLTWTSEQDAALDLSAVRLEVTGDRYLVWHIVAPSGLPKTFTLPTLPADLAMRDLRPSDVVRGELHNVDWVGVTTSEVLQRRLDSVYGFIDKPRRGATARTQ